MNINISIFYEFRYPTFGESIIIMYDFRIRKTTVFNLVLKCCNYLWDTDTYNKNVSIYMLIDKNNP